MRWRGDDVIGISPEGTARPRGLYELRVNGHRVGNGELTPGWTDYRQRVPYQVYDVIDLVGAGRCAWGRCWRRLWSGSLGWDLPGFDDSSWAPGRVADTGHAVIVQSAAEPPAGRPGHRPCAERWTPRRSASPGDRWPGSPGPAGRPWCAGPGPGGIRSPRRAIDDAQAGWWIAGSGRWTPRGR
ncbi:alpha-L-rhamnosidase N-terminal domain-containing protein [Nonomuraea sp. KM90]|uniref:alpha-L-rhamnosidase N-terminal domain-containing protein n=1 Tax=Nonomuraea sp. KM90 TaxID=3457428 RepID=UPI003FCCD52F